MKKTSWCFYKSEKGFDYYMSYYGSMRLTWKSNRIGKNYFGIGENPLIWFPSENLVIKFLSV